MTKLTAFFIALVFHFLFDFVFQGAKVAQNKKFLNVYLVIHGLTMGIVGALCLWFYYQTLYSLLGSFIIIGTSHLLIDGLKSSLSKNHPASALLGLDQIFHIFIFYLLFSFF